MKAWISEVFNSIQGEGPYVGERQVFLRFQGCDLHCEYCDSPESLTRSPTYKAEIRPGSGEFEEYTNPVDVDTIVRLIRGLDAPGTRSLSLTGGEPLLQHEFILELAGQVDMPLYLETNATRPEKAREVAGIIDVASCDVKLPGHGATEDYEEVLQREIETIRVLYEAGVEVFAKVVLTPGQAANVEKAAELLAGISPAIPLVLQPVTPTREIASPDMGEILQALEIAAGYVEVVRVIPQVHRYLGVL